uniref:Uncharacterized protein n=1 Tax=Dulem virus 61 TaxID=3145772 RepID=A0AAU8BCA6_9VIRU
MGALFQGVCYPSDTDAKQAACSAHFVQWGGSRGIYTSICDSASNNVMNVCIRENGNACTYISHPYPNFPKCDYHGGVDFSLEWAYLILPVVVTLWGMKRLIRFFDGSNEP